MLRDLLKCCATIYFANSLPYVKCDAYYFVLRHISLLLASSRTAGRSRGIDQTAAEIKAELRKPTAPTGSGRNRDGPTHARPAPGARHRLQQRRGPGPGGCG